MYNEEAKIREKAMMLVKQKLVTKLKDLEVSEEQHIELEKELLEDLEETIQAQLLTYRKFLQNDYEHHGENSESEDHNVDSYDDTNIPQFYWGEEDCCEMVFSDETS